MIRGVVGANPANNTTPGELRFYTTSIGTSQSVQERLRIGSDGKLMLLNSPGIDFSQIQTNNSGMTSETLDSYEEGTFTPSFTAGITSPVHSYRVGSYTKIGRVVNFAIRISVSSGTEISTQGLVIGGLPFSSIASNVGVQGGAYFIYTTNFIYGSGGPTPTLYIPPNTTTIQFYNDQGSTWHGDSGQGVVGSAMYLRGQYLTSS